MSAADAPLLGAVETGGTTIRCAVGTTYDDLRTVEFPTDAPQATVDAIVAFLRDAGPVAGVGVAAFGPLELDPDSPAWGTLGPTPKPGWAGFALGPSLRDRLGVPVALETDVNGAALAEASRGAGRGADPVAYVTAGTGVGLGAVVGGRPLHGLLHPEAGHLRIARRAGDDAPGVCPIHGDCLEGLASGPSVAARWGADPAQLAPDHPAWDLEAGYLAAGLAAVTLILSPQRIVLGGGIGRRPEVLAGVRTALRAELAGTLERPADVERFVVAPAFGDRSGLVGAWLLAAQVDSRRWKNER